MKTFRWFTASALALAAVPLPAASMDGFSPYRLSEIDKTISSDAFEGRGVNTPAEAFNTFTQSGMDVLVLEDYVIEKTGR